MDPYLEFLRDWFREAGELFFKRVEAELWKFAEPFYAWLYDLFEHPTPDWRASLETFLAGQAAEGRTLTPESYASIVAYLEWWAATNRWPAAQPESSGSLSLAQIGPYDDLQLDGTRAGAEIRFGPSDDYGLPELPEEKGPGILGELLDPELPPLVRSAAEYRQSQIEAHGDSPLTSALIRFNEAINRYGWGIEDRHEELESPSERTANDLADLAFAVANLAGAAAGTAAGKQPPRGVQVAKPKVPRNPLHDVIEGRAQKTGTEGHAFRTYRQAIKMAKSGEYDKIWLNRAYSTTTGTRTTPRRLPDIIGRRKTGQFDAFEVPSRTDIDDVLIGRNLEAMNQLPAGQRGSVDLAPIARSKK